MRARDLVERGEELVLIGEAVADAAAGRGRTLLVEGAPGVGKTSLLEEVADRAGVAGMLVLRAAGAVLEQDLSWGVARSALGPTLASAPGRRRRLQGAAAAATPLFTGEPAPADGDRTGALLHGLYWLVADLCAERPMALVVDDVHWADVPSTRWLAHLGVRAHELALLLALAARPLPDRPWWQSLAASPAAAIMAPRPLSHEGSTAVVAGRLGDVPDSVADACHEVTGGNPFLLAELLRQVAAEGAVTDGDRIRALRPESIRRAVLRRLGELGPRAIALTYAIAVLGRGATLPLAADLARLHPEDAAAIAADLQDAAIIRDGPRLEFIHPLVREVIEHEIPQARLRALHLAAAGLLARRHVPASQRAPHLLATEPDGRAETVATLREAAAEAMATGAPEAAVGYLRRAVREPPLPADAVAVLVELGRAEGALADPAGVGHMRQALERVSDPAQRAAIVRELAGQLIGRGEIAEAIAACHRAAAALPESERELRLALLAHARTAASQDLQAVAPDLPGVDVETLSGATAGERLLLAALANARTRVGAAPIAEAYELATRALHGTALLEDVGAGSPQFWNAAMVVMFSEHYDQAQELIAAAVADSRRRGSPRGYGLCLAFGSPLHFRLGRLAAAAEDARRAAEIFASEPVVRALALSFRLEALIDQGAVEEARAVADGLSLPASTSVAGFTRMRGSRARVLRLSGDPAAAAAELLEAGREHAEVSPVFFPWRAEAALALVAAGDAERARRLALEAVEHGERVGSRWVLTRALHALGVTEGSVTPLHRAEALTRGRPIRLERARVLVELGAGLRRRGRLQEATAALREGLDLADRCGAQPLQDRARDELRACGARPRHSRVTGPEALTPSELRVSLMAARGTSNRDIAQALFVSLRTVETHLTRSYAKLGISGREELDAALRAAPAGAEAEV